MATKRTKTLKKKPSMAFVGNPFDADAISRHHDAVAAAPWLAGMATPSAEPRRKSVSLRVLCMFPDVEADHKVLDGFDDEAHRQADQAADASDGGGEAEALCKLFLNAAEAARRHRAIAEQKLSVRFCNAFERVLGVDIDVFTDESLLDDIHGEVKIGDKWIAIEAYDLVFVDETFRAAAAYLQYLASRVAYIGNVKQERTYPRIRRYRIPATLTSLLRRLGDEVETRRQQVTMPWAPPLPVVPAPTLDDAAVDAVIVAAVRG